MDGVVMTRFHQVPDRKLCSAAKTTAPGSDAVQMGMLGLHSVGVGRQGILLGASRGAVKAFNLALLPSGPALLLGAHLAGHLAGQLLVHLGAGALVGGTA